MRRITICGVLTLVLAMATSAVLADEPPGVETLAAWMTGSFASSAQAAEDPDYRDIRLHVAPIWPDADDGRWLYVEQAAVGKEDAPYRQRVYRLRELASGVFESEIYTLVEPERFVGAWHDDSSRVALARDHIRRRESCNVTLRWTGESFEGGTEGRRCASDLAGATHATSEVTVRDGYLASWDRGFTDDGEQVWGAEKGAYIFLRTSP